MQRLLLLLAQLSPTPSMKVSMYFRALGYLDLLPAEILCSAHSARLSSITWQTTFGFIHCLIAHLFILVAILLHAVYLSSSRRGPPCRFDQW